MASRSGSLLLGEEPRYAARQAAILFCISGVLAALAGLIGPAETTGLVWIGLADLAVGCVAWVLPWDRWGPMSPLALSVPALSLLAISTWGFSGFASGSGPFFVLMLAWVGLHYRPRLMVLLVPMVAVSYIVPLALRRSAMLHAPPAMVTMVGGLVLVGTGVAIAFMISNQVTYQQRALEQVREMEQWRAALMGALAHDVRLPVTAVLFSLEMLEDDWPDLRPEQRRELLAAALRQTMRIQRLADGLLDVERLSGEGRLRLDLADVPLRSAVDAAAGFLAVPGLIVDVDPGLFVRADAERLEQVLINLIGNAVRHGRPPVIIAATPTDDSVRLEIRDHGDGVSEALRDRLFDRFSSSYEDSGSVGLGLWITRRLVEAHEGDVWYEPADPGARFVVTLSRAPGPSDLAELSAEPAPAHADHAEADHAEAGHAERMVRADPGAQAGPGPCGRTVP